MAMVNRLNVSECYHSVFFFLIQDGSTLLHDAAWKGHLEVVTKLLDSGADMDIKDNVRKGFVME